MAKSKLGHAVFSISADRSELKRELAASKTDVQNAVRDMKATARVSLNAPSEMGRLSPSLANQVEGRLAQVERINRNRLNRQRVNTLARRDLESRGLNPGAILGRDRDQEAFDKFIRSRDDQLFSEFLDTRNRRRERARRRFDNYIGSLQRARDPMSDAERMRGGMPITTREQSSSAMGALAAGAAGAAAGATIATAVFVAKRTVDALVESRTISKMIGIEGARLGGIQGRLSQIGLGAEAGLQSSAFRVMQAQASLQRWQSIPMGSVFNAIGKPHITNAQLRLEQVQREQSASESAVASMGGYRVRAAAFSGGVPQDQLVVNRAARAEEMRRHMEQRALFPNNIELQRAGGALRDAQAGEEAADTMGFRHRQRMLRMGLGELGIEGQLSQAQLSGSSRQEFILSRAATLASTRRSFEDRWANAPESERHGIATQMEQARLNFEKETAFLNRTRMESPGSAMGISPREAQGAFIDPTVQSLNETKGILMEIYEAITRLSLN